MDEAAWGALALALTLLGGIYTWFAYQRRGLAAGVRGAASRCCRVAAWLTGVLELLTEIGGAVGDWAVDLAFSPTMWLGHRRWAGSPSCCSSSPGSSPSAAQAEPRAGQAGEAGRPGRKALPPAGAAPSLRRSWTTASTAEIEAILRKRGIT